MGYIIERWAIKWLINFILSQLAKFQEEFDWDLFKKNVDQKVVDVVPGTWFDATAVQFVNRVFDSLRRVLDQNDKIKELLQLLSEKKFGEAYDLIKSLFEEEVGESLVYPQCDVKMKELCAKL